MNIRNCINIGDVLSTIDHNNECFIGGIVGYFCGGSVMMDCRNEGNVSSEGNYLRWDSWYSRNKELYI